MLRRSHRVTTKLFEEAMKRGRVLHSPLFVVRILQEASVGPTRVSAAAPVKVAKTSVLRHRIRRRVYEAARPHVSKLIPGHIVVFLAKQPVVTAEFADLKRAVTDVFVKAGLLR